MTKQYVNSVTCKSKQKISYRCTFARFTPHVEHLRSCASLNDFRIYIIFRFTFATAETNLTNVFLSFFGEVFIGAIFPILAFCSRFINQISPCFLAIICIKWSYKSWGWNVRNIFSLTSQFWLFKLYNLNFGTQMYVKTLKKL